MVIDNNITKVELVKIIRSLIAFIVKDSRDFVKEGLKEAYIKKYLFTLSRAMNGTNNFIDVNTLWEIVEKDISSLLKEE